MPDTVQTVWHILFHLTVIATLWGNHYYYFRDKLRVWKLSDLPNIIHLDSSQVFVSHFCLLLTWTFSTEATT